MKRIFPYLNQNVPIAPLAMFRVLFGFMMFLSVLRFLLKGWVRDFYLEPQLSFPYFGFEWVQPLGPVGMYALFFLMGVSALAIMLGWRYRIAAIFFFLSFTYIELIDKTYYLNHYYFVSLVSFAMIFLPAHRYFSIDVLRNPGLSATKVPRWTIGVIRLQLAFVYFFAGIAKLNHPWLFEAMPLKIWLMGQSDLPLIGPLFDLTWTPYLFSWFGAIYDLFIVFFLLSYRTRWWAYAAVIAFHGMTGLLFNIGMFPYIMIISTLVFFSASFHDRIIHQLKRLFQRVQPRSPMPAERNASQPAWKLMVMSVFFALQLGLIFRNIAYPGDLFWTEEGYRFSWRVMLVEKAGTAFFFVTDPNSGGTLEVDNKQFLTRDQEKQMAFQPDMILQYAHFLRDHYRGRCIVVRGDTIRIGEPKVTAEVYVRMNNSGSRLFIDPAVDLAKVNDGFAPKTWILPHE